MKIYVTIAGQHDNLGDVVLHRSMLKAVRSLGQLVVVSYTLNEPYMRAVVDSEAGDVYLEPVEWRAELHAVSGREPVLYFQKPGEIILSRRKLADDIKNIPTLRRVARRGGATFILGVGIRNSVRWWQKLALRLAYEPYALVGWRDVRTARELQIGQVMPDWAFGDGTPGAEQGVGESHKRRDQLVVSLRVDRPEPSAEWLAAVRLFAEQRGLSVVAVCQVARDMPRCEMLAEQLGGTVGPWVEDDFVATEEALRALYRRTAMAVSDRLHVLIIAATEGAVPFCLLDWPEDKIARHFDAIGYPGSAETVSGPDVNARIARLDHHIERRQELVSACDQARDDIRAIERKLTQIRPQ